MEKPTGSPAAGAKEKIEKQARQLAYDTRYKVRQAMNKGTKLNPAQVSKAYMSQLAKSSAAPAVKARAKQMLLGEDLVDTKRLATDTIVSAMYKVFVEGVEEEVVVENTDYIQQLNEMEEKKYKIRVTDKKTGNTYVRMATRAKIAELRANPNISSVEMTQYGEPTKSEKHKGSSTAKAKSGKGLDPVGQEDKDIDNDGDHDKTDKYLLNRRKVRGKAIATRKEDYNWQDGFAELIEKKKEESGEKKITGEGVNNSKLITVFPDENSGIKEEAEDQKQLQQQQAQKSSDSKTEQRKKQTIANQKKILMAKLQQLQKGIPLSQEEVEVEGEQIDEKITAKTDMGDAIKDFYASKSPQLAGRTKEERRKAAIAAVLTARRGGRKLGEEVKKEKDPREIPTEIDLVKARLRAKGIKVSGITPSPRNTETVELPPIGEQMTTQTQFKPLPSSGSTGTNTPPPAPQLPPPSAAKKPVKKPLMVNSYEAEGEVIDERTRERKGQPRPARNRATEMMRKMPEVKKGLMTRSGKTVAKHEAERGVKKEPGAPTPTGETTADRLEAKKRKAEIAKAAAQRAQDNMSSRFD